MRPSQEQKGGLFMQVKELRAEIDRLLLRKIRAPDFDLSQSKAVDAMHQLLATDGF